MPATENRLKKPKISASSAATTSAYYDESYFAWQERHGKFGGWANVSKFHGSVSPQDRVLDFGCGGGFLLSNLACANRFGIEPNAAAHAIAEANGVTVFARPADALKALGLKSLDVIISDNALEHTLEPWRELQSLLPLLKPGGKLHIVVPCEGIWWRYKSNDINQHLYSWGPQSLGNLLKSAGYDVVFSRPYVHKWPSRGGAQLLAKFGRSAFDFGARIWGHIDRRWFQIEALAIAPKE